MKAASITSVCFLLCKSLGSSSAVVDVAIDGNIPRHDETNHSRRAAAAVCNNNNQCEVTEDASSCPSDCTSLSLSTASTGGDKGSMVQIFSIKSLAQRDITITSMDIYTRSIQSSKLVQLYTRVGDYNGYELIDDGWDLIYDAKQVLRGRNVPTSIDSLNISIPADTVQSLLIYTPNKIRYTTGGDNEDGGSFAKDEMIEIYDGVGARRLFTGNYTTDVYSPRRFTGVIRYDAGPVPTLETNAPTQSPTKAGRGNNSKSWYTNWDTFTCHQNNAPLWNNKWYDSKEECCNSFFFLPSFVAKCISFEESDSGSGSGESGASTLAPTTAPFKSPSASPVSSSPSSSPTKVPVTDIPSNAPSAKPVTLSPSTQPSSKPITDRPTDIVTDIPSKAPSSRPVTESPFTTSPSRQPTAKPVEPAAPAPTSKPSTSPTKSPVARHVTKISFVAFGDTPYTKDQRYCLNKQLRELNQQEMGFKFIAHVGDIKSGKTTCYESSFSDVAEVFSHKSNALNYDPRDVFFVPGDNEWVDCQDPDQAWRWWMKYFGNGNRSKSGILKNSIGFGTLSDPNIKVNYENKALVNNRRDYPSSSSNFAFFTENVLFVGINQVGGGKHGDESTRVHANYKWVETNLNKYISQGMRAIVIFAHAHMTSTRREYFGKPLMSLMRNHRDIKAIYIHGDGHNFEISTPDLNNSNLVQLEVDGGEEADPLLISVMHDTVKDEFSFNIDVRGGYYYSGCKTGNTDKTWSSDY